MEIKVIRVYLTGSKRIHELYEENQRFLQKQEELRRAVRAQDRQMKGYGRDFEALLRERVCPQAGPPLPSLPQVRHRPFLQLRCRPEAQPV